MIDTIVIRFFVTLPPRFYKGWKDKRRGGKTYQQYFGGKVFEQHFGFPQGKGFFAVYHPLYWGKADYRGPILDIFVSVPKLVYGCNHVMLAWEHFPKALDLADKLIHLIPEFAELPGVREAELVGVDPCYNWYVGNDMHYYLRTVETAGYRNRKPHIYPTGCSYPSSIISPEAYDKGAECKHAAASGWLRFEPHVRDSRYIKRLLGKEHPTVMDLSPDVAYGILEKVLCAFHLSDRILCSESEAAARITARFAGKRLLIRHLIQYCQDKNTLLPEVLTVRYSRPTIRKYERLLGEAGVSSTLISEPRILPALKIDRKKRDDSRMDICGPHTDQGSAE